MCLDSDAYRVSTRKIFNKMCTDTLGQRKFNYTEHHARSSRKREQHEFAFKIQIRKKKKKQKVEIMFMREPLSLAIAVEWWFAVGRSDRIRMLFIYFDPIKINRKFSDAFVVIVAVTDSFAAIHIWFVYISVAFALILAFAFSFSSHLFVRQHSGSDVFVSCFLSAMALIVFSVRL